MVMHCSISWSSFFFSSQTKKIKWKLFQGSSKKHFLAHIIIFLLFEIKLVLKNDLLMSRHWIVYTQLLLCINVIKNQNKMMNGKQNDLVFYFELHQRLSIDGFSLQFLFNTRVYDSVHIDCHKLRSNSNQKMLKYVTFWWLQLHSPIFL